MPPRAASDLTCLPTIVASIRVTHGLSWCKSRTIHLFSHVCFPIYTLHKKIHLKEHETWPVVISVEEAVSAGRIHQQKSNFSVKGKRSEILFSTGRGRVPFTLEANCEWRVLITRASDSRQRLRFFRRQRVRVCLFCGMTSADPNSVIHLAH